MARKIIPLRRKKQEPKLSRAEQSQRANRTILRRTLVLMALFGVVVFIPLIVTLYNLMIRDHDYYEAQAIDNQTRYTSLSASRGQIFDRNMNVFASSKTVETVFIDPNEIAQEMAKPENSNLLDHIARGLSEILDVSTDFVYKQASDKAFRYKVIRRKIPEELADEVRNFVSENEIKGVYLETDAQRYYPYSSLAAQVLGFVSRDNVGQEGLEAYYDSELEGTAGKVVTSKGNYGSEMLYTYEKYYDASDGDSFVLTIDATVQSYLEKNLQNAIDKYGILNGAFGIVMDVNTGEIVAMSTMGSYDPNHYQDVYDEETAQTLEEQYQKALLLREGSPEYDAAMKAYNEAVAAARLKQWRNRCVSDGYEPGSTFKLVTMAAALDSGSVTVNDSFYCGGHEDFKGRDQTLSCWKSAGHGAETLEEALGNSCNIAFGHIGLRIGGEEFYDYINSFGFLEQTGVDLPGEAKGLFFSKADLSGASTASLISASFGQTFRITPIQLVRAVAAIVNGGYLLEPHIVSSVLDADGNERASSDEGPACGFVFKTIADPFSGQLNMVRVISGTISSESTLKNMRTEESERLGTLLYLDGKTQTPCKDVLGPGAIIAVGKLKNTRTGDTLSDDKAPFAVAMPQLAPQLITFALAPKEKGDEDKVYAAVQKLLDEDVTLKLSRDEESGDILLSGMGQLHIETAVERAKRRYKVEILLKTPKVPYRETVRGKVQVQGRHKKQSGGRGQFGDCWIEMEGLPRGSGYVFEDAIVGGAIPRNYIPAIDKGVQESAARGFIAGCPVVDFKVRLYDGSYHTVDSSEMAFKVAGSLAFKKAIESLKPVLLEPIVLLCVSVPDEYMGDVIGDLSSRRGKVLGSDSQVGITEIKAHIPMSEVLRYAPDLRSITGGQGVFTMEFDHYEEAPQPIVDKVIAEHQKAKAEE